MKKLKLIMLLIALLFVFEGCDKDFAEINTDPFAMVDLDPGLLFAGRQRTYIGDWQSEPYLVQYFMLPYNLGQTLSFQFNADIDAMQNGCWDQYTTAVRSFVRILYMIETMPQHEDRINLKSITRIWKAMLFMNMVDHYGNVPYFNAGKATDGQDYWFNAYDDQVAIYEDLYKEIKESLADLNPSGDFVSADLFYGTSGFYPTSSAATHVAQWKKLGNSLLLRLGMRYSKLNPTKAASIVAEAFNGGVMTNNRDNAFVVYDGTNYVNSYHSRLITSGSVPYYYYAAHPFVEYLKSVNDPRGKYMVNIFANPNAPLTDPNPNTVLSEQFGVPMGVQNNVLVDKDLTEALGYVFRGINPTSGLNYSQFNVNCGASTLSPTYWLTYAQTSLLLAEAAHRGWIPGGDAQAKEYYENAIIADMDRYDLFIDQTGSNLPPVTQAEKDAYLVHPLVAYNAANALELINTQYWVANVWDPQEAWANFRRTGYPVLIPNPSKAYVDLTLDGNDGHVRRFTYPDAEVTRNYKNYTDAVAKLPRGVDALTSRIFWDPN